MERLIGTHIRSSSLEGPRALITLQPHGRSIATAFASILEYTRLPGWLLGQARFERAHMGKLHIGYLKPGLGGGLSALALMPLGLVLPMILYDCPNEDTITHFSRLSTPRNELSMRPQKWFDF
jgi:hypothetical protein